MINPGVVKNALGIWVLGSWEAALSEVLLAGASPYSPLLLLLGRLPLLSRVLDY